ncbi:MAG: hypothetical protein WEA61_10755 [Anaerolineales bacterium]
MERKVGEVTHFFAGPSAAVLRLSAQLKTGDEVHIVGATTDFIEKVTSMQIDHNDVETAWPGDDVAILVKDRVREGDEVFLVEVDTAVKAPLMGAAPSSTPATVSAPKPVAPSAPAPKPAAPVALPARVQPKPAAMAQPKPAAKAQPKPAAKAKPKAAKPKVKPKAKAKPKKAAKAKAKPKAKAKAKPKGKAKAKPKKKKR